MKMYKAEKLLTTGENGIFWTRKLTAKEVETGTFARWRLRSLFVVRPLVTAVSSKSSYLPGVRL